MNSILIVLVIILIFYLVTGKNVLALVAGLVSIPFLYMINKKEMNSNQDIITGGGNKGTNIIGFLSGIYSEKAYDDATSPDEKTKIKEEMSKKMEELNVLEINGKDIAKSMRLSKRFKSWTTLAKQKIVDKYETWVIKDDSSDKKPVNLTYIVGDMDNIPDSLNKKTYDLIILDNKLQNANDVKETLDKVKNMMNKNGHLFIALPSKEYLEKAKEKETAENVERLTKNIDNLDKIVKILETEFKIIKEDKKKSLYLMVNENKKEKKATK